MSIAEQIADRAVEWAKLEVPYRHRGMSRHGCDCTGLIIGIARELGLLRNYKLRQYKPDWNLHAGASDIITQEIEKVADIIPKRDLRKGDIVTFTFGKCVSHTGIYIKDGLFIHSYARHKCKYGKLQGSQWVSRWEKTYRFNETKMRL